MPLRVLLLRHAQVNQNQTRPTPVSYCIQGIDLLGSSRARTVAIYAASLFSTDMLLFILIVVCRHLLAVHKLVFRFSDCNSYSCRYAEAHSCDFDYKTAGRQQLAKNNPLIQASKVEKL